MDLKTLPEGLTLLFLDTEFTTLINTQPTDLISIGIAAPSAARFYAEITDFPLGRCTDFVKREVLPLTALVPCLRAPRAQVAAELARWLAALPPFRRARRLHRRLRTSGGIGRGASSELPRLRRS